MTIQTFEEYFTKSLDSVAGVNNWKWNDNSVEVILINPDKHPIVRFKQVLDFFESIEVDLLKESSLKTLLDTYQWFKNPWTYEKTLETIIDLSESEWVKIIGANGSKIYASLHRRLSNMKLETICGSLNYCGAGFGIRRAKIMLSQIDPNTVWTLNEDHISRLNGFDDKTAKKIAQGLPLIKAFIDQNSDYITLVEEKKTDEMKDIAVVFTGFRDSELEERVEKMGGKISSGVSKKTTYLVAADPSSNSGKAGKARELGVKVLSIDEFKDMFNL